MSILATKTSLRAAQGIYKEIAKRDKPAHVAKRGMFALVERRHSYMSLRDRHHAWSTFTPAIVTSVSRKGVAKEVRYHVGGQWWTLKARNWLSITIDSRQQIADPDAVACALINECGHAIEYRDQSEAVAAIKAAAGPA
jgi:hypothetical protein